MAINEAFSTSTSDQDSAVITPSNDVSEALVDGDFTGTIHLKYQRTGASTWFTVFSTTGKVAPATPNGEFASPVLTPDAGVSYKYVGVNIVGTPNVYLGP